jgi:ATP-binding cassette subfamily B protein
MTTAAANKTLDKNHMEASIDQPDQAPSTLNRLLGYMVGGDQRGRLILGVLTRIVALIGLTALPFITGQAMNVISEPGGSRDQLYRWVLYGAIAGVTYLLFSYFSDRLFARMATHGLYKLQTTLFSNLQTLSMGFFFKNPPGELSSNITNDAEVVSLFYTSAVGQLIRAVLQITMILIVMLVIN